MGIIIINMSNELKNFNRETNFKINKENETLRQSTRQRLRSDKEQNHDKEFQNNC